MPEYELFSGFEKFNISRISQIVSLCSLEESLFDIYSKGLGFADMLVFAILKSDRYVRSVNAKGNSDLAVWPGCADQTSPCILCRLRLESWAF